MSKLVLTAETGRDSFMRMLALRSGFLGDMARRTSPAKIVSIESYEKVRDARKTGTRRFRRGPVLASTETNAYPNWRTPLPTSCCGFPGARETLSECGAARSFSAAADGPACCWAMRQASLCTTNAEAVAVLGDLPKYNNIINDVNIETVATTT